MHILYLDLLKSQKRFLKMLLSVSGIGANIARTMLSSLDQNKSQMQLHQQMLSRYSQLKELSKTAQRVILDLKEKVLKLYDLDEVSMSQSNTNRDEALSALEVLGFVRKTSEKIIEKIVKKIQKLLWNLLLKSFKTYKIKFKNTDCI
jgi:Holliday junction DNA helicase RuvA